MKISRRNLLKFSALAAPYFFISNEVKASIVPSLAADGVTDDAPAIQAAINNAGTTPRGARVILPSGSIRIASTINLPTTGKNVTLQGEGDISTMLIMDSSLATPGLTVGSLIPGTCGLACEGFTIYGSPTQKGMSVNNGNGFRLDNMGLDGLYIGVEAAESYGLSICNKSRFQNLALYGLLTNTKAHGLRVRDTGFFHVGYVLGGPAIVMTGPDRSTNVVIDGNDFEYVGTSFQANPGVSALSFTGNYTEHAVNGIFWFGAASKGVIIRGNEFELSADTTIGNVVGLDFSYNSLYNQKFIMAASTTGKTIAGNGLYGTSSIS